MCFSTTMKEDFMLLYVATCGVKFFSRHNAVLKFWECFGA